MINEMRAILDALACTLAVRDGAENVTLTYFPTGKDQETFESKSVQQKVRHLSEQDRQIIVDLKPYRGGNDMLYALHSSDIRKHQRLIVMASVVAGTTLGKKGGWVLDGSNCTTSTPGRGIQRASRLLRRRTTTT
jgi:hypothetical protein